MKKYKNIIKEMSKAVIGKQNRSKRNSWFNTVCEEVLVRRNDARLTWLADTTNYENERRYIARSKEAHNIFTCEKRKYIRNLILDAEMDHRAHRTR